MHTDQLEFDQLNSNWSSWNSTGQIFILTGPVGIQLVRFLTGPVGIQLVKF